MAVQNIDTVFLFVVQEIQDDGSARPDRPVTT
jgi:hypothetical protein